MLKHLGLGVKGEFIHQMMGVHWKDLLADPGKMMRYSLRMQSMTWKDAGRFSFTCVHTSLTSKHIVMDRVIKMATQPILQDRPDRA